MRNGIFGITLAVSCAFGTVSVAQNLGAKAVPAELPPSSFSGRQYVDSKGCVYIRAGVSGVTNWVPRVSRDRNVICGQTPTFAGRTAVAAAPAPAPAPQVVAPAPVVRQVAAPAPRRVVRQVAPAPVAVQPVFTAQRIFQGNGSANTGAVANTQTRVNLGGTCPNASAASRAYMNTVGVRCGSQAWKPESAGRVMQGAVANSGYATPTYVAPTYSNNTQGYTAPASNIYEPRILSDANAYTPKNHFSRNLPHRGHGVSVLDPGVAYQAAPTGYRNTWQDGRLNPARGITGQEIYQPTNGARVNTTGVRVGPQAQVGWFPPRPGTTSSYNGASASNYAAPSATYAAPTANYAAPAANYAASPTISTRSAAPQAAAKPAAAAPSGHRWVQVGSFSAAGAQQTARRFQGMGLPVRIGKASTYQVVLIGPYSNSNALSRALSSARGAGYSDAYTRR